MVHGRECRRVTACSLQELAGLAGPAVHGGIKDREAHEFGQLLGDGHDGAERCPERVIDEIVGAGGAITNATDAEVPPPGAGVTTVTAADPAAATSAAVIAAVS